MGFRHARNASPQVGACLAVLCWAGGNGCNATASRTKVSLESPDPSVRVLAIVRAADRDDRSAVPLLVDRLEDEDAATRMRAAYLLWRVTGDRKTAVETFVETLRGDDADLRQNAFWHLRAMGVEAAEAVPTLVEMLPQEDTQHGEIAKEPASGSEEKLYH